MRSRYQCQAVQWLYSKTAAGTMESNTCAVKYLGYVYLSAVSYQDRLPRLPALCACGFSLTNQRHALHHFAKDNCKETEQISGRATLTMFTGCCAQYHRSQLFPLPVQQKPVPTKALCFSTKRRFQWRFTWTRARLTGNTDFQCVWLMTYHACRPARDRPRCTEKTVSRLYLALHWPCSKSLALHASIESFRPRRWGHILTRHLCRPPE